MSLSIICELLLRLIAGNLGVYTPTSSAQVHILALVFLAQVPCYYSKNTLPLRCLLVV